MILFWALRLGIFLFIRIKKIKKDRRFDGIRENFFKFFKFWFLQGITVWIILLPSLMFFNSETKISLFSWIGFAIWFIGLTIETFSDLQKYQFNKDNKNKISGYQQDYGNIQDIQITLEKYLCWIGIYLFTFSSLSTLTKNIFI